MKLQWMALGFVCVWLQTSAPAVDVRVVDRPLVSRLLLGKSPSRGIAVGYPNQFNAVLDSVTFTPLYTWSGGFLNVDGELRGRGGRACAIGGPRIDLQLPSVPLRLGSETALPASVVFKGYRRNGYEPPTFYAEIDGHRVGLRIWSRARHQVTLEYALPETRKTEAYFLFDPAKKSEVLIEEQHIWSEEKGCFVIPADQKDFRITLDLSARKSVVMESEKVTGKLLYQQYCSACHALDAQKLIGPSFQNLWSSKVTVNAGTRKKEIQVDADYIRRSIQDPQAEIVEGYEAVPMPPFKDLLSPAEIEMLVAFIQGGAK